MSHPLQQLSLLSVLIVCFIPLHTISQTVFTENAQDVGINHVYLKSVYLGGGAAWFDYDNDGFEDVYITGGSFRDELYKNNGDGTFTEVGGKAGLNSTFRFVTNGVVTGDIDNDGDRDIFLTTDKTFNNVLLKNNGDGTFTDISEPAGIMNDSAFSMIAAFGDVNLDGFLDIFVGNYVYKSGFIIDSITYRPAGYAHECSPNFLYLSNGPDPETGEITYSEVGKSLGITDSGCTLATTFTDYDKDGDVDIMVVNDFGEWVIPNKLYRNDYPANHFTDVSDSTAMNAGMYGMGIAIGDYDQDLDLDYYITNIGRNGLFQYHQEGFFADVTTAAGVEDIYSEDKYTVGWGTVFADVDNDTDLDLFVTNGYVPPLSITNNNKNIPNRLFINQGNLHFSEEGIHAGIATEEIGRGSACADYDMDGDMDYITVPVAVTTAGGPEKYVKLFRNDLANNYNWLKVKLIGTVNNRDAFGAQMKVVLADRSWLHEIQSGSSHASQNSSIAHFGLGNNSQVDSLLITWPGGKKQLVTNISANQLIEIVENENLYTYNSPEESMLDLTAYPNPFTEKTHFTYRLFEEVKVNFSIFNHLGQKVNTLENTVKTIGKHRITWDGTDQFGQKVSTGMYFCKLIFGNKQVSMLIQLDD
ncbi:MAG: VCBS repeat-containing protein [Bacteroidetes bacterium]|nr:VCBS repeat-containing protein [Bacteroidota bacterium]